MPDGRQTIRGSELTFTNVNRHHAGKYECTADNGYGVQVSLVALRTRLHYVTNYQKHDSLITFKG